MAGNFVDHVSQVTNRRDVVPAADYNSSTDTVLTCQGMYHKTLLLKNTGTTYANYSVSASIDEVQWDATGATLTWDMRAVKTISANTEFDLLYVIGATLAAGATGTVNITDNCTAIKVQVKGPAGSAVAVKSIFSSN